MTDARPDWDSYFLMHANVALCRSTCPRRHVGAVLTVGTRLVATGYNGSLTGQPHCEDVGCLMAEVDGRQSCVRTVHAEVNAMAQAALHGVSTAGATLYVTTFPCWACFRLLVSAGVTRVCFGGDYDQAQYERVREVASNMNIKLKRVSL